MKKYFLFFVTMTFLFITACKDNVTNPIVNSDNNHFYEGATYFNGTINGTDWSGGGIAFIEKDSSLHIRGIYGKLSNYNQIDILISKPESGSSFIDSGKASVCTVTGGDAVERPYISFGNQTDGITYNRNEQEGYISGQFNFKGQINFNSLIIDTSVVSISGNFKIQAAKSETKWEMSYDKNGNISCSFKK